MDAFTPGLPKRISDVPASGCISFAAHETRIGFVVALASGQRYILDPHHTRDGGTSYPSLYPEDRHFSQEHCIYYPEARLRPSYMPGDLTKGYARRGGISRALFLTEGALIIQAALDNHRYCAIDLRTGALWEGEPSHLFTTSQWWVEIPVGIDKFAELAAFSA